MAKIFRQIVARTAWEKGLEIDGVPAGEAPADVLLSFKTQQSGLSIYFVDDSQDALERLIAAYCAKRNNVGHLDYVLLDLNDFSDLPLQLRDVPGELPDVEVNAWHRDVIALSVSSLAQFAHRMHERGTIGRALDKNIGKLINLQLQAGKVDESQLNTELKAELKLKKYQPSQAVS